MGSRIMHVIIANRIADCLAFEDRTEFLLGSIAPDAVSPKDASHFFTGDIRDYSRSVDYRGFLYKYRSQEDCEYILGYFTHLIADHIWLKGFYLPWLRNRMEANSELLNVYHHDFRLLNGKLLNYYGFENELRRTLFFKPTIFDMQEVRAKDVEEFIPQVLGDMEYDKAVIHEQLHVFTLDQIVGYIESSVELGLWHIKNLR